MIIIADGGSTKTNWCLVTDEQKKVYFNTEGYNPYFSSEAYDDYGPEHDTYADHVSLQMPDPRDWEIVEALAADGVGRLDRLRVDHPGRRFGITPLGQPDLLA